MTWPSSDVNTTNADAGTDSPATFRTDVLDLLTKFNLLRNHVSTLGQTLLNRATAALMRADIGAAASGANADITSLTTALMPLGNGQTWADFSASRAVNTTYTNSTGRSIVVSIPVYVPATSQILFYVGGIVVSSVQNRSTTVSAYMTVEAIVPNGATYYLSATGATFYSWAELR